MGAPLKLSGAPESRHEPFHTPNRRHSACSGGPWAIDWGSSDPFPKRFPIDRVHGPAGRRTR